MYGCGQTPAAGVDGDKQQLPLLPAGVCRAPLCSPPHDLLTKRLCVPIVSMLQCITTDRNRQGVVSSWLHSSPSDYDNTPVVRSVQRPASSPCVYRTPPPPLEGHQQAVLGLSSAHVPYSCGLPMPPHLNEDHQCPKGLPGLKHEPS
jgi:hypothetical protein